MISFQLNISCSELTLICSYYLKQVAKVNWKKNLAQINVYWWQWHYFIMYISHWNVHQVNYKEESFAWKYIVKFTVNNKLMWKFARRLLTTKVYCSFKVYCWCLHKFHYVFLLFEFHFYFYVNKEMFLISLFQEQLKKKKH